MILKSYSIASFTGWRKIHHSIYLLLVDQFKCYIAAHIWSENFAKCSKILTLPCMCNSIPYLYLYIIFHYGIYFRTLFPYFLCLYLLPCISVCSVAISSSPCPFLGKMCNANCLRSQNSQLNTVLPKTVNTEWRPKLRKRKKVIFGWKT